jgi:hypothetical protein
MAKLNAQSPFPFGKAHKDRPMEKVPVRYLHWVWENCDPSPDVDDVREYIVENYKVLSEEDEDLIWTKFGKYKNIADAQQFPQ